ncbi:MAG: DUF1573 domain-containing protein [Bacteroidetes bacterium]|nr:DUF1573 domain-containing protein [Bacteroidota bacterium]
MKLGFLLFVSFISIASYAQDSSTIDLKQAEITFEELEFDFGEMYQGETVSHTFKFTNTGNAPLVITSTKVSCGCTVPYKPSEPIQPGQTSEIVVNFTKSTVGEHRKTITIDANSKVGRHYLSISALVIEPDSNTIAEKAKEEELKQEDRITIQKAHDNCIAIYPNPADDLLQVELKDHIGKPAEIEILNEMGRSVSRKQIASITQESTKIDVSGYTPGVYLIAITINGIEPITQCFVVR